MALVNISSSSADLWFEPDPSLEHFAESDWYEEAPRSQSRSFSLTLLTPTTDEKTLKIVKRTLASTIRDWEEIAESRKCTTERSYSYCKNYSDLVSEDSAAYMAYKGIASRITFELGTSGNFFMLLTDSDKRVQAVAVLSEIDEAIEVSTILSAAWNIAMHGENAPEHKQIAVEKAGTTLMRQIYEFARYKRKAKVCLESSKFAEGFYKKLQMKMDGDRQFYFDVSATSTPATLQSSKNLLPTILG